MQERKKVKLIIFGMFVAAISSYLIILYYVIHATTDLGLGVAKVSVLLTVIAVLERGLGFVGGFLVDQFGAKVVAIIGVIFRSISLCVFWLI